MSSSPGPKKPYVAPRLERIGSLHELTQSVDKYANNPGDGFNFNNVLLSNG